MSLLNPTLLHFAQKQPELMVEEITFWLLNSPFETWLQSLQLLGNLETSKPFLNISAGFDATQWKDETTLKHWHSKS